jgi:ABC-type multidrug transport system ATPase subunit
MGNVIKALVLPEHTPIPLWVLIWPPFAFYRLIYLNFVGCVSMRCMQWADVVAGEAVRSLVALAISVPVLIVVGLYLDAVLPQDFGQQLHPLFFLAPLRRLFRPPKGDPMASGTFPAAAGAAPPASAVRSYGSELRQLRAEEDEAVGRERDEVERGLHKTAPVVCRGLGKDYGGHTALHSLSLALRAGECFGLLGPNGAGKTTLISILTGLYLPSRGSAAVAGFPLTTHLRYAQRHIGVCPQFDVLWDELTCREHLLFYARLKGVAPGEEAAHVDRLLEQVGLQSEADKHAAALSGGMKRRLSVGMALAGHPAIVILDEPTTGLDPVTKRHLWNILGDCKGGRCLLLTTHSMEEAEVLSSRIGLMDHGRLRALGTPLELKTRYGPGYRLTFAANGPLEAAQVEVAASLPAGARPLAGFRDSGAFQLPREGVDLGRLFLAMQSLQGRGVVREWGLSQASLEDVFVSIVDRRATS